MALIGSVSLVNAQSPYKLEVEQEVVGTDLHMTLFATKLGGTDFSFGSSNFAVVIDTANLDIDNMTKLQDGIWDDGTDAQSYLDVYLGKGPNFVNLTTRRNTSGTGLGQILTSTKELIAKIAIPIKNQCTTNNSSWVILPAAQNKFGVIDIKQDAQFINPDPFPLCEAPASPNLMYAGNDTICEGDIAELSTSSTGEIQWYLDGVELVGETNQTLSVNTAGSYTVEAVNCICKTMSLTSQQIIVNLLPITPIITQNGNALQIDNTDAQIFWYKDGNLYASNTTVIDNLEDGVYTVMLKNDCGDKMSAPLEIVTSSITSELVTGMSAFPNPFKESTQIKLTLADSRNISLIVYNVLGEQVEVLMEGKKSAGEYIVNFDTRENQASDGVYLVKLLIDDEEADVLKLVEIK